MRRNSILSLLAMIATATPAIDFYHADAQTAASNEQSALMDELKALRAHQIKLEEQIKALEARFALDKTPDTSPGLIRVHGTNASSVSVIEPNFELSGDLRLRWETNQSEGSLPSRNRGAVRGRFALSGPLSDEWTFGTRLVTGAQDDPNSTDVTFGNFNDDLEISLDQLFVTRQYGPIELWLGKYPRLFAATDLAWDGDITLQGFGADYQIFDQGAADFGVRTAFSIIDENPSGDDSFMVGGQVYFNSQLTENITFRSALAYYDYTLDNLSNADAGDFRTNRLTPDGRYISDFDLVDGLVALDLPGPTSDWPVSVNANFVHNVGAEISEDFGWRLGLSMGALQDTKGMRFGYDYSEVEEDAVFTAFSNDNIAIASGYSLHTLDGVIRLSDRLDLNLVAYFYRDERDQNILSVLDDGAWQTRVRTNLVFRF